ncbi:MAG TPA: DUF3857 domain-containing protein [Bryobacteraceae bacterium]|jgi:tetratricopeptide (TPR) repeat protein|nr:DUF3857 domain-containing protein [Bryobacteraceae bacterium]
MDIRRFPVWVASALAILPCAYCAQPWDEPFAKDTQAIAQAARAIVRTDNPGLIVLLDEYRYFVHSDGRADLIHRKLYRVMQQNAVEQWSSVEQGYQPWYQKKPEIRARVIGPEGDAHLLDPKTVADGPAGDLDASTYSDARVTRAPLPSMTAGSVVEYQIAVQDLAPLLDAGVTFRAAVDLVPVERFHFIVETDPGVPLRFGARMIPESAIQRSTGKSMRVECDFGPFDPPKHFEGNLPAEVSNRPYVAFSTGRSWQSVAARYASIVDQKLQGTDWKSLLDGVDLKGDTRAVASRLTAKLHEGVRYTGVEFGQAAIVPGTPSETIRRGYGDCKDKSTLLVAMLRAAGLKADVALLNSGYGVDVDSDLPGMGVFDHAIVHVGSDPPLWIDATAAETRVGFLPGQDQGRQALIANAETAGLTKVPESTSADAEYHDSFEVKMSEFGSGTVRETVQASGGSRESMARATYGGDDPKLKERLETYVKQTLASKRLGKYDASPAKELSGPYHLEVEGLETRLSSTGLDDAGVAIAPWTLFDNLPYTLKMTEADAGEDAQKRKNDFVFAEPYRLEVRYKIIPPPLFKVANVPESKQVKIGTGTYTRNYRSNADGTFEASYRFDSGKRRLTPEEFEEYRADLKKYDARKPELITFYPETAEFMALGQSGKALALIRDATAAHPDSAMAHVRLSHMLLVAHLGGAALAEARKATELDAKFTLGWQQLADVYEHDTFGRSMQGNWSPAEAEKCYRKALELDPDNDNIKMNLAILLEFNTHGWRYAKDSRLDESIALYGEILKKHDNQQVEKNLTIALLRAGKLEDAKTEAGKVEDESRVTMLAMIAAMQEGPARAIVNAQTAYPDPGQRAQFLTNVGALLTQVRQYSGAAAVFNAAARVGNVPGVSQRAELLGRIKRWDDALLPEDDPRFPVQHLMLEAVRNNLTRPVLEPLVSSRADFTDMDKELSGVQNGLAMVRRVFSSSGLTEESIADVVVSLLELTKVGDDEHGYRITASTQAGALGIGGSGMPPMYVMREDGKYKLIGAGTDGSEMIGGLVLDLLAKHDLPGARQWLDMVAHDVEAREDGTGLPVIKSMWSGVTPESRGVEPARLAAQVLIATSTGKLDAIQKLVQARPKAANALDRAQIDKAICESMQKARNWEGLLAAARQLQTAHLFGEEGFRYYLMAAKGLRKWPEIAVEAKKRYDSNPLNEAAVKALVLAAAGQGDWVRAADWATKLGKNGIFQIEEAEMEAWTAMLAGNPTEVTLTSLHKVKDVASQKVDYQYTDALLETALQKPEDATEALLRGIGDEDYYHLHPAAWAAYAHICEQYGFPAEAEAAMTMARTSTHANDDISDWVSTLLNGPSGAKH